jgi:hypothetical protein
VLVHGVQFRSRVGTRLYQASPWRRHGFPSEEDEDAEPAWGSYCT